MAIRGALSLACFFCCGSCVSALSIVPGTAEHVDDRHDVTARPSVLFVAGLEGTGHHLMGKVLKTCAKRNETCAWPIKHEEHEENTSMIFEEESQESLKSLSEKIEIVALEHPDVKLILANTWPFKDLRQGMMASYPDRWRWRERHPHRLDPNLPLIEHAAKKVDIGLEVILLIRSSGMLIRECLEKHRASTGEDCVARLQEHGLSLLQQLKGLDSGTPILCLEYEKFAKKAVTIADGLGQNEIREVMEGLFAPQNVEYDPELDIIKGPVEAVNVQLTSMCKEKATKMRFSNFFGNLLDQLFDD